jgi:hypothetical protein
MAPPPASDKAEPFKSLLAAWSLAVVVVAVAGFSLHWTYFYNFGLQNQVLEAPLASLPIYAIEMVRNGENLLTLLISAIVFLLPFQALLLVLRRSANAQSPGVACSARFVMRLCALDNELTVDAIRAGLLIWVAFHAGGVVGYRNYCLNVDERTSRLPRATVVFLGNDGDVKPPFACDANSPDNKTVAAMPTFVGDAATMLFNASGAACSSPTRSWRLLCRNLV